MDAKRNGNDISSHRAVFGVRPKLRRQSEHDAESITNICSSILNMLDSVNKTIASNTAKRPNTPAELSYILEDHADDLWDSFSDFARELSAAPAASLNDVASKISLWRRFASDPDEDSENLSVDELLMFSIAKDIERLQARAKKNCGCKPEKKG